jgi:molecular chaperone DnaJ
VDDNSQVRLRGEGQAGTRSGHSGDLYITLAVEEHELFQRNGDDIIYELPINFAQAALGTQVEVPTIDGKKSKLKIPVGSQTGKVFRLKNKGVPHLRRRGRGDQLVTLLVVTPDSLTKKQRQLFQELADTLGPAESPH